MNPISIFFGSYWLHGLLFAAGMAVGGVASHVYDTAQVATVRAELAGVKTRHAEQQAQDAAAALARLQTANQRADALQTALDVTEQRLSITKTEMNREILRNTSGRACLNGRTVGLLNNAAAGRYPATLSSAASGTAEAGTGFTTDTDIANWISDAVAQYNICRARLDALIDWHLPSGGKHD